MGPADPMIGGPLFRWYVVQEDTPNILDEPAEESTKEAVQAEVKKAVQYGHFEPPHGIHIEFNGVDFKTLGPHHYQDAISRLTVPDAFQCDLTTIPWIIRIFLPKMGRYTRGSLFHDLLYRIKITSRWRADAFFMEIMERDGVIWPLRYVIWKAVRYFGWIAWMRKREP